MKVLFLSTWFPYPPDNGSKIRVYHLLRALTRDHQLTLVAFHAGGCGGKKSSQSWASTNIEVHSVAVDPFRYVGAPTLVKFASPIPLASWPSGLMRDKVAQVSRGRDWDAVVAFEEPAARYALQLWDVPRVLDVDFSSSYQRYKEYVQADGALARLRAWAGWKKAHRFERELFRQFAACTLVMPEEATWIRSTIRGCRVEVSQNGVDCERNRSHIADKSPNTLIYNGALTYRANYDAMQWFLGEVYPRIRAQIPDVSLIITGSTKDVDLASLGLDASVRLTGYVHDVRLPVAEATICVVPIRQGGGTRIKILEAMALGTPVVSTSKGAEGLEVVDEKHLILADYPAEFAARTVALLKNDGLRRRLASNARRLVEEQYDWAEIGRRFVGLVEEVVAAGHGSGS